MEPQLSQRVWIITGASSGLGLAMASHILAKGDRVRTAHVASIITRMLNIA